jgi:hypothetical protein
MFYGGWPTSVGKGFGKAVPVGGGFINPWGYGI